MQRNRNKLPYSKVKQTPPERGVITGVSEVSCDGEYYDGGEYVTDFTGGGEMGKMSETEILKRGTGILKEDGVTVVESEEVNKPEKGVR